MLETNIVDDSTVAQGIGQEAEEAFVAIRLGFNTGALRGGIGFWGP